MSKVLIIGSRGTLGTYLTKFLTSQFKVATYDYRFTSQHNHSTDLENFIQKNSIKKVINCVGATDVSRCEADKLYAYNGNTLIPEVISKIQNRNINNIKVINFSSDQVYPGTGNALETNAYPLNVYGQSKLRGEQMLNDNACNLRINYVSKGKNRNSFSDWVVHTAQNHDHVTLYKDVFFNPVDINTVGKCVAHVLNNKIIGTYNVGALSKLNKAEFYYKLAKTLNLKNPNTTSESYSLSNETPRPLDMSMNITKSLQHGFVLPTISDVIESLSKEYLDAN